MVTVLVSPTDPVNTSVPEADAKSLGVLAVVPAVEVYQVTEYAPGLSSPEGGCATKKI